MIIETIVKAVDLRKNLSENPVPEGVGYYKWYATKEDFIKLLEELELDFDNIPPEQWDIENGLYCIYLGIATKSLKNRIVDWHINQHNTLSLIKSGYLSTLRNSISSVLFKNQADETGTNNFIDGLTIHYYYFDDLDPNLESSGEQIEKLETGLINDGHLKILNGAKNKNPYRSRKLSKLRKKGKEEGIRLLSQQSK